MKTRSRPLYAYLLKAGVLNGTQADIDSAKQDYRRHYKRQWKQRKCAKKEIRFTVSVQQFNAIKATADAKKIRHSSFARNALLESIGQPTIPDALLLEVLQLVSMASIAIDRSRDVDRAGDLLHEAEAKLLEHLKR